MTHLLTAAWKREGNLKSRHIVLLGLILSLIFPARVFSTQSSDERALRGVEEFQVWTTSNSTIASGLSLDRLQTVIELRLRKEGLRINEKSDVVIHVHLDVCHLSILPDDMGIDYECELAVLQGVTLERDPGVSLLCITWNKKVDGQADIGDDKAIVESIEELLDEFMNSYLSANQQ